MTSYYILRSDLTSYYVNDVIERLQAGPDQRGWDVGALILMHCGSVNRMILKDIEATLHCLTSIQEGSPVEDNVDLKRIFSSETLGLLPKAGFIRLRRTTVVLIGNSRNYFTYFRHSWEQVLMRLGLLHNRKVLQLALPH